MNNDIAKNIILNVAFITLGIITAFGITACSSTPVQSSNAQSGVASYYSDKLHGRTTASGEKYNKNAKTAAHRTLPFGTKIQVTNKANNKSVIVKVNDRGPFTAGRVVDLSRAAFSAIGDTRDGLLDVSIIILN